MAATTYTGTRNGDRLSARTSGDTLEGLGGNDILSSGTTALSGVKLFGGDGNDTLIAKDIDGLIDGGAGIDTVQFSAAVSSANLTNAELVSIEKVQITNTGSAAYDFSVQAEALVITGGRAADNITGGAGNDTITGGLGADSLTGGNGDDVLVADASDALISGGDGNDTVQFAAAVSGLTDGELLAVENVVITNTGNAAYDFSLQDEVLNIQGGRGKDTITGGTAADTLSGGNGNDLLIAKAADALVDGGAGNDTVKYDADVGLGALTDAELVNVEYVVITDTNGGMYDFSSQTEGLDITGTGSIDSIKGGRGADVLRGGLGNDHLYAGDNDKLIDGGIGSDTAYFASSVSAKNLLDADLINVENISIEAGSYDFSSQSEKLVISATGGAVTLTGGKSADTLTGGAGDDVIAADDLDVINGGAGTNTARFAAGVSKANFVDADLQNIRNIVITNTKAASYDFSAQTEALNFEGGSSNDVIITAADTMDTLRGGAGNDVLVAEAYDLDGDGVDDGASDKFDALIDGGTGIDTVRFAASVTGLTDLQLANVELVELTNAAGGSYDFGLQTESLQITGSAGSDTITGGFRADTITGGAGADSISAGDGVDVIVADASDTLVDGGEGYDTVRYAAAVASLADGALNLVENIQITNTSAASYNFGSQSEKLNIMGGTASDTLIGGTGIDTLSGGAGDDALAAQDTDALIDGGAGTDTARFGAAVMASNLADADLVNVERVQITKTDASAIYDFSAQSEGLTIIGNSHDDVIIGGASADSVAGAAGNDTLTGGAGNDTLSGGDGQDKLLGGLGADSLLGGDDNDILVVEDTDARIDGGANIVVLVDARVLDGGTGGDTAQFAKGISASNLSNEDLVEIERIEITNTTTDETYDFSAQVEALIIKGNSRNDIIIGGRDWDAIRAGGGNDTLFGGLGKDQFNVDAGHDTIADFEVREGLYIAAGASATATGVLDYSQMNVWGDGVLNINGTDGADSINGSAIDDLILGGKGNDTILGNDGDDTLVGGAGIDKLYGGEGDDVFLFPVLSDIDGLAETIDGGNHHAGDKIVLGASGTVNLSAATIVGVERLDYHSGGNDVQVAAGQIGIGKILTITGGAGTDTLRTSDRNLNLNGVFFSSIENLNLMAAGDTTLTIDDEDLGTGKITSITSADAAGIDALVTDDRTLNVEDVTLTNIDTLESTASGSAVITVADSQLRGSGVTTITVADDGIDPDILQTNDSTLNLVGVTLNNIDKLVVDADNNGGNDTLTLNSADLAGLSAIEASPDGNNNKLTTPDADLDVDGLDMTNIDTLESTFAGTSVVTLRNDQLGEPGGVTTIMTTADSGDTDELRTADATLDLTDITLINIDKVYSTATGNTTITMDDADLGPPGVTIVGSADSAGTDVLQTNDSTLDVSDVTLLNVDTLMVDADGNDSGDQTITVNPSQLGTDADGKVNTIGSGSAAANVTLKLSSPGTVDLSILNLVNIDSVQGSNGADNITGRAIDDTMLGGAGADTLDGGGSVDGNTLSFADFTSSTAYGLSGLTGIAVNLSGADISTATVKTAMTATLGGATPGSDGPVLEGSRSWNSLTWGSSAYLVLPENNSLLMGDRDLVRNFTRVIGSDLNDYIVGSTGANTITGGLGDDYVKGGTGIDTFQVTWGTDRIADVNAGDADDILVVSAGATANVTVAAATGGAWPANTWVASVATINNGTVNITLEDGSAGIDMRLASGSDGYTISAGNDGDQLIGSTKADTLYGGAGNDILTGDAGDDALYDVQGVNAINVGSDRDRVFFTSAASSGDYTNKVFGDASNVTVMLLDVSTTDYVDGTVDRSYVYVPDSDKISGYISAGATDSLDVVHFYGGDLYDTYWGDIEYTFWLFGTVHTGVWDGRWWSTSTSVVNASYDSELAGNNLDTAAEVFDWASDGVAYDIHGTSYWPAPDAPDQGTNYETISYIQTQSAGWRGYLTFEYFGYTYMYYANAGGDNEVHSNEMFYVGRFQGIVPTTYQFYSLTDGIPTWTGSGTSVDTPPTPLRALDFADADDNGDSSTDDVTSNTTGLTFSSTVGSSNPVHVFTRLGTDPIVDQGAANISGSSATIDLNLAVDDSNAYKVWFVQAPNATYTDVDWLAFDEATLADVETLVINVKSEVVKPVVSNVTATESGLTVTATDNVASGLTANIVVGSSTLYSSSSFASGSSSTIAVSQQSSAVAGQIRVLDAAGNGASFFGQVALGASAGETLTGSDTITGGTGGVDFLYGFGGNDTINGKTGADYLYGGDGNDTFQFVSRTALNGDVTVVGGTGNDTIEITAADTGIVDADFTDVATVETLSLTGASSAVLGTEAAAAGINKVDTGTGNTTITATVLTTLTVASDVVDGATLTLDVGAGDDVNFTVTGLLADLTVDNDHTGNVAVTLASVANTTVAFGTNITGTHTVNADALTDLQVLTLTGSDAASVALTAGDLTASAYAGDLTVTATTGTNVITTGSGNDTITGGAGVDSLSGGTGDDTFKIASLADIDALAEQIYGGTSGADSGADSLTFDVAGTANISSATISGIETLNLNSGSNAITLTLTQHDAFSTVNAAGTADSFTISGDGAVTTKSAIETYTVGDDLTNSRLVTVSAAGQSVTASSTTDAVTFDIGTLSYTGTLTGDVTTDDKLKMGSGASIAGATITGIEDLELASGASVTMTQSQNNAFTATDSTITAAGTETINIAAGDLTTVTGLSAIESYVLGDDTSGNAVTFTVKSAGQSVTASSADDAVTFDIGTLTYTGTLTGQGANDTLKIGGSTDISGATISDIRNLVVASGATVTMTASQYNAFTGTITADGGWDSIILTAPLTSAATLSAAIESFTLAAGANSVTSAANQNIDANNLQDTQVLTLAGSDNVTVWLTNGDLTSTSTGNLKVTAGGGSSVITTGSGDDTITGGAGVDSLSAGTGNDLFILDSSSAAVGETYDGGGQTTADVLRVTGTSVLNLSDDTLTSIETLDLTKAADGTAATDDQVVQLNAGQVDALSTIDASGADRIELQDAMTASMLDGTVVNGTLTIKLKDVASNTLMLVETVMDASTDLLKVDGSGLTGTNALTFVGSAETTGKASVTGGAGNDSLTGIWGSDTLVGGAGADTIDGDAGADSLDGGAGDDRFVFDFGAMEGSSADATVIGGDGTDTMYFWGGGGINTDVTDAEFAKVIGMENLILSHNHMASSVTFASNANSAFVSGITITKDLGTTLRVDGSDAAFTRTITATGGTGNDTLIGGSNNDTITGGDGSDSLLGGGGADTFKFASTVALSGDATVVGGDGTDTLEFTAAIDPLYTGNFETDVRRVSQVERVKLFGASNINLGGNIKAAGIGTVLTGDDNTTLRHDTAAADVFNVDADALLDGKVLTLIGGSASGKQFDVTNLRGDLSAASFGGSISVAAASGTGFAISLTAGQGNDTLTGGEGEDTIVGGNGNDTIWGGSSWEVDLDSLSGGTGDDVFNYIFENSIVSDGVGTETIDGGDGTDALVLQAASGVITLTKGTNHITNVEVIRFAPTPPVTDNLSVVLDQGMAATSDLGGTDSGTVRVEAATGSNFSTYGVNINAADFTSTSELVVDGTNFGGNDTMSGGAGNDSITGGAGADSLTGGAGKDTFAYGTLATVSAQTGITLADADTIADFVSGTDFIKTGTAGTATNYAEGAAAADFGTAQASAAIAFNGTVVFYLTSTSADGGLLFVDSDANGTSDAVIKLTGITDANFALSDIIA